VHLLSLHAIIIIIFIIVIIITIIILLIIIINTNIINIIALIGILSSRYLAGWIHSGQRQGHYPREAQREEGWTSERGEWV